MSFMDHLEPKARKRLEDVAEELFVAEKELLIRNGERSGDFYRVVRGTLEVVDSSAMPVLILDVLGPGTVVGEMGYLTGEPRSADVRAGEESVVLRWRKETLDRVLETNASLASAFYKASAQLLSKRLGQLNRAASQGAISGNSDRAAVPEDVRGARALADGLKTELRDLEASVARSTADEARKLLAPIAGRFVDSGRRMMAALPAPEREVAGELLARELQPYMMRAQLARLAITRESGYSGEPALLAHAELGEASGSDPLGVALDAMLLHQPTAAAHRSRQQPTVDAVLGLIGEMRSARHRVTVLHAGSGTLIARLLTAIGQACGERGADLTVLDGDREALAFLNSGTSTRPPTVKLRLVHEDLSRICTGASEVFFGRQDIIVVNGLVDYLPERTLATLLRKLRDHLLPGGAVVMTLLTPSHESFVFDHLLTWRTVRRPASSVVQFCEGLRYVECETAWTGDAGAVVVARLPQDFQRTLPVLPVPR